MPPSLPVPWRARRRPNELRTQQSRVRPWANGWGNAGLSGRGIAVAIYENVRQQTRLPTYVPAMTRIAPAALRHQVLLRLDTLPALSYATLAELPAWRTEQVLLGVNVAHVTTYSERLTDGTLENVVQCMPEGEATGRIWRGVVAERFCIAPDGTHRRLPDAVKFGFM